MSIRYLILCMLMATAAMAVPPTNGNSIASAVQSATALLQQDSVTTESGLETAQVLIDAADKLPSDSLYDDALFLAQRIYELLDECAESVPICRRLVQNAPLSVYREQCFESLWNHFTENGVFPLKGSDFAIDMAIAARGPLSTEYFHRGFEVFMGEGMWDLASDAGIRYLQFVDRIYDPAVCLEITDALLKAGDSDRAVELLTNLINEFPQDPATVRGRTELGLIQLALGDVSDAQESFSRAWSTYQKYRKRDDFDDPQVIHSAARALWEIQERDVSALKNKLADRIRTSDKTVKRDIKRIESGYELVAAADPAYAMSCWTRIGDLHVLIAEAALQEGYESLHVGAGNPERNPYDQSLPFFADARVAYEAAMKSAAPEPHADAHWSDLKTDWKRMAIHGRYNALSRQADIIYAWSDEIWKHAPERGLGSDGLSRRFELLTDRVVPLVQQSLSYRRLSFDAAAVHPHEFALDETWKRVNDETWTTLTLVRDLCSLQWKATQSTATQLSKTLKITGDPAAVRTLRETLIGQMDFAQDYWNNGQESIQELYLSYLECDPSQETRTRWEDAMMGFHHTFAQLTGETSRQLDASTGNLDPLDPIAQTLKQRLRSLAADAARAERDALTTALATSDRFRILNSTSREVYRRLRELDPAHYPSYEIYQASRK